MSLTYRDAEDADPSTGMTGFPGTVTMTVVYSQVPRDVGKGGVTYQAYDAFCMEPSHFPDSPNQPSFPTTTLSPGDTYRGQIVYNSAWAREPRPGRRFADALLGLLVLPEALEARVPGVATRGPLREAHLRDEPGDREPHEPSVARDADRGRGLRLVPPERSR